MKFVQAIYFAVALIAGVAVGYMFNPSVDDQPRPAGKEKAVVRDDDSAATIKALRARIAELEAKRDRRQERKAEKLSETPEESAKKPEASRERRDLPSPREWQERMKKEHPEQYIQMTNRIAQFRRERLERAQKKVDFLASIDTSTMSPAARKNHENLQDLIAKREELEQKMHEMMSSGQMMSHEDRRSVFQEMRETDEQIREHNAIERQNLMLETAKNLGLSGNDAKEVAEAFQQIIENTEGGWNSTGRPDRGGRGGNRGGNRGFPPPPGR